MIMATLLSPRALAAGLLVPLLYIFVHAHPALAQPYGDDGYDGSGIVRVIDWPHSLLEAAEATPSRDDLYDRLQGADLLPFVDTLALGYSYGIEAGQPLLSFALDWGRGEFGIVDGRKVHAALLPEDVRLTEIELRASVHASGQPAADLFIVVDSLDLAPRPELYLFDVFELGWDEVFDGVGADSARAIFEGGFTLARLEVLQIRFEAFESAEALGRTAPRRPRTAERRPEPVVIDDWHGGIFIDLGPRAPRRPATGPIRGDDLGRGRPGDPDVVRGGTRGSDDTRGPEGPDARPERGQDATERPDRGKAADEPAAAPDEEQPRTERTKSGRGFPFPSRSDDEDEDDETSMVPAALAGAAAVAVFAAAGGTVGYYGNAKTPLGLSSGYVRPQGGFLLQASANAAALGADGDVGRFIGRSVFFFDAFGSPLQPALSAGVYAEKIDGDVELQPALGLGIIGNFGTHLVQAGYDFVVGGIDFGIAFNFKHRRSAGR